MTTVHSKILIIEDSYERLQWFIKNMEYFVELHFATDARAALAQLAQRQFDCVFFDHDLGDAIEDSSWILNNMLFGDETYNTPKKAVIHSSNSVGVENIASKLEQLGVECQCIPFENLQQASNFKDFLKGL